MKFLTIFLAILTIICACFWYADGPGSGMKGATSILVAATVGLLIFNKLHTGSWLSDNAMGR